MNEIENIFMGIWQLHYIIPVDYFILQFPWNWPWRPSFSFLHGLVAYKPQNHSNRVTANSVTFDICFD